MSKRLFVGNLSFDVSEDQLQQTFAEWGANEVAIPVNESGRPKGFGFVNVDSDKAQTAIDAVNGRELAGRAVTVNEAKPREDRSGGGSRGGYAGSRGARW